VSFIVYDAVCICTSLYSRMICSERERIWKWSWPDEGTVGLGNLWGASVRVVKECQSWFEQPGIRCVLVCSTATVQLCWLADLFGKHNCKYTTALLLRLWLGYVHKCLYHYVWCECSSWIYLTWMSCPTQVYRFTYRVVCWEFVVIKAQLTEVCPLHIHIHCKRTGRSWPYSSVWHTLCEWPQVKNLKNTDYLLLYSYEYDSVTLTHFPSFISVMWQ